MTQPEMEAIVATRFSYLGNSGWKISPEAQRAALFNPDNLRTRLTLFEKINLASLRDQTRSDFHHYILTSAELPPWAMKELHAICATAYPAGNFTIDARPYGNARRYLRLFMTRHCKSDPVLQVVLDDDDGLAVDFMEKMRQEFQTLLPDTGVAHDFAYVSFARGIGLVFRTSDDEEPKAYKHSYPYINLGLTMMGTRSGKNIFAIDHRTAPLRSPNSLVKGQLMFVRSLHDHNDSRAGIGGRWREIADWKENEPLIERFPCLTEV